MIHVMILLFTKKKAPSSSQHPCAVCLSIVRSLWTNTLGNVQEWCDWHSHQSATRAKTNLTSAVGWKQVWDTVCLLTGAGSWCWFMLSGIIIYNLWLLLLILSLTLCTWDIIKESSFRVKEHLVLMIHFWRNLFNVVFKFESNFGVQLCAIFFFPADIFRLAEHFLNIMVLRFCQVFWVFWVHFYISTAATCIQCNTISIHFL